MVHEKLRSYFKEIGMSQVEIAEKLGVSKNDRQQSSYWLQ